MKKVIKIWMSCIITLVLTVGIIYKLGELVRPINTDIALNAINTFHDMPHLFHQINNYSVLILLKHYPSFPLPSLAESNIYLSNYCTISYC